MPLIQTPSQSLFYERDGHGPRTLIFVHGWLGSSAWWEAQAAHFAGRHTVLRLDLPGHGRSGEPASGYTPEVYADAIRTVAEHAATTDAILVAHSMAGAFALQASLAMPMLRAIVLVDTLKNLDQLMSLADARAGILYSYRTDYAATVSGVLPRYLFSDHTPAPVKAALLDQFLRVAPDKAAAVIEPLYAMDVRAVARQVTVPVRAINADTTPTAPDANRRYVRDYGFTPIAGSGHYPMLERPEEFNRILDAVLDGLR